MNKKINKNKISNSVREIKKDKEMHKSKLVNFTNKLKNKINRDKLIKYGLVSALLGLCVIPEVLASATLEGQIDKINVLTSGKVKTVSISFATIVCATVAIIKSSPVLALTIVGIGIGLAYYLEWIAGGMILGSTVVAQQAFNTLADNLSLIS